MNKSSIDEMPWEQTKQLKVLRKEGFSWGLVLGFNQNLIKSFL